MQRRSNAARRYRVRMSDPAASDLVSALEVIEQQPLAARADGYAALHDELARRLESTTPSRQIDDGSA